MKELRASSELKLLCSEALLEEVDKAANMCHSALRQGSKLLFFGNGGSAADAQHLAAEFVGRYKRDRRSLPVIALTTDTSALTAIGNDYGFGAVFSRQIEGIGRPGDVAIAITTSGASQNIIEALDVARKRGLGTICLSGKGGGRAAELCDIAIVVPSDETARIQECHITIGHVICELVDRDFASDRPLPSVHGERVLTLSQLLPIREQFRRERLIVVWTNGCFDLLHVGHVRSLEAAKATGDALIVGVNGDRSVRNLKGEGRPILPAAERAEIVSSVRAVDFVTIFEEDTPVEVLTRLKPDVHAKGEDYRSVASDRMPEASVVESYGGRIEFLPLYPESSTTSLLFKLDRRSRRQEN
jgi:phosphoheptose isomerase